ncbi:MAG: hypothetical protein JNK75_09315 [Betaproteobacteria bacterium]|nr:hypothetical protein [Betaproteobacteria bacterium]
MSEGLVIGIGIGGIVLFLVLFSLLGRWMKRSAERTALAARERNETLYRAMFPELQPHYHPERLLDFVQALRKRRGNKKRPEPDWNDVPGFPGLNATFVATEKGERVTLKEPAGKAVTDFLYQDVDNAGVLRVGKGKLTVDLANPADPRVRYWHPEREFKWSRKGWTFKTPMADEPFTSSTSDSSHSSFTSSSSSADSRAATAVAFAGAGGAFDGGGAAGSWDAASAGAGGDSDGTSGGESSTAY